MENLENTINWKTELKEVIEVDISICTRSDELVRKLKSRIKGFTIPNDLEYILSKANLSHVIYKMFEDEQKKEKKYDDLVSKNKTVLLDGLKNQKYNQKQVGYGNIVIDVIKDCWIVSENQNKGEVIEEPNQLDNKLDELTPEKSKELQDSIITNDEFEKSRQAQQTNGVIIGVQQEQQNQQTIQLRKEELRKLLEEQEKIEKDIKTNNEELKKIDEKIEKRKDFSHKEKILTEKLNDLKVLKSEKDELDKTFFTLEKEFKEYEKIFQEHSSKMKEYEEKLGVVNK